MKSLVESGFAIPQYKQTGMFSESASAKTKAPRLIFGSQIQSTIVEPCELGEKLLDVLEEVHPKNEHRIRSILTSIIEEEKIYWLGFFDLPLEEKKLIADIFLKADIFTHDIDPYGIVYSVNFMDLGDNKYPCLMYDGMEIARSLYLKSLRDASALAHSWSLRHSPPARIDRIYTVNGKLRMEEVDILKNDYRGKEWASSPAPLQQSEPLPIRI
jgi:hypothetical protein